MKPRLLDLFSGAGGCARGYQQAGFYVVGVDHKPQPRYAGDEFYEADALAVLDFLLAGNEWQGYLLADFDAIHASPPCQFGSKTQRIQGNDHPNHIERVRELLDATGLPYLIENVPDAYPWMRSPIRLEGQAFGLNTHRPRLFEANWALEAPPLIPAPPRQAKMGRKPKPGEAIQVVGHFTDVEAAREAMDIDWMTRDELAQAIPPAYTEYVGSQLLAEIHARQAA